MINENKKYLVLTNGYPSEKNLYSNGFVHARVKAYMEENLDIVVFVLKKESEYFEYNFDGVKVLVGELSHLYKYYEENRIEKCLCHFIDGRMMKFILNKQVETIVWVHGAEALGWYRRLFNLKEPGFLDYVIANTKQLITLRKFINNYKKVTFVFVSQWMKQILEKDTRTKVENYKIIPNIINTELFKYSEKDIEDRKKILTIRPFNSKKYANDVTVDAILKLSKEDFFSDLEITICGDGKDFDGLTNPLKVFKNVQLKKRFFKHEEIKELHDKNGVFLCPTRQDAQGVSMCEAMASGLVPITSNNTAIPEFVNHYNTGFLTNNSNEIVEAIKQIYNNPEQYLTLSYNACKSINESCNREKILKEEIDLIKK